MLMQMSMVTCAFYFGAVTLCTCVFYRAMKNDIINQSISFKWGVQIINMMTYIKITCSLLEIILSNIICFL